MALPSCAVFNFHHTPPETAATITMNTNRIGSTGLRFADSGISSASSGAAAVSVATVVSTATAFSARLPRIGGISRIAAAGVELTAGTTAFLPAAGTTVAGTFGPAPAEALTTGAGAVETTTAGAATTGAATTGAA